MQDQRTVQLILGALYVVKQVIGIGLSAMYASFLTVKSPVGIRMTTGSTQCLVEGL